MTHNLKHTEWDTDIKQHQYLSRTEDDTYLDEVPRAVMSACSMPPMKL